MPRAFIKKTTARIEKLLGKKRIRLPKSELVVVFLDPGPAKKINFEFRKKNYATDVLSFQNGQGLGELLICPQVIAKQAKEHALTFHQELAYMILHGILHLRGFDHEKGAAQAKKMFKLQDEVFAQLS